MKVIDSALKGVEGYLISMERDTEHGWYTLQVGLPKNWVFDSNTEIDCDVINETSVGKIVRISPLNENIVADDLFEFLSIIIKTNNRIAEKEKEFSDRMDEMKSVLEKEAKKFYEELDELKENSFKKINDDFERDLKEKSGDTPKEKTVPKKRTPKTKEVKASETTERVSDDKKD